ncbi:restriction endonuclease subunit S [Burkholderia ubonensis]|uniref:Type I restriction modification DNA specificity domain-containing protein n=1 Tax=Burkholderia ubonensis TaxID=101571 RepID=A0ABD4DTZ0_9BURK|nr:restriction endonuclease subunit S [Burkholderia ubonensis]KVN74616.1 hypothetical protein WJ68_28990 [Burkholderia ubonensis]KVU45264.1 hypothetical protein WK69_15725 [Burkholderia ubonensis]KVZ62581.1 hypothetical protein WL19_29775 [Burkholderia ubonensis]
MSLPTYPKYKDSGIDWVAELPAHWGIASLKWLCQRYSGGTPDKNRPEYWEEGTIPWLNSGAVNDGRIYEPSAFITQAAFENSSAKWIPSGALVMALAGQGKTKGMVAQLMIESTCNQSMAAIVLNELVNARFTYWWLACNYQNIRNMAGGDLRDGLNLELLGTIPCLLPPLFEQSIIAAFLDRETAKIDALIAAQEKLVVLLTEKRQATISHAVTHGLNPDAPMKDSGVAWLGYVPAHWRVVPLKRLLADVKAGPFGSALTKEMYVASGYRVYGQEQVIPADFSVGDYYIDDSKYTELQQYSVRAGDILISCVGTFGKIAIVPENAEPGIINPRLIRVRVGANLSGRYLEAVLRSSVVFEQFSMVSRGGTMDVINIGTLNAVTLAVPPMREQEDLLAFLDEETTKLDQLKSEAERAIDLLKERRSALIAAAVTGKIDVRNAVPQELAA